jgi:hypothetical protein
MKLILSWLEVWTFLIPIFFLITIKRDREYFIPVKIFIAIAFVLNLVSNIISNQKKIGYTLPWHNNIALYNLDSISRLLLFSWFFLMLKQPFLKILKLLLPAVFIIFVVIDFNYVESFYKEKISTNVRLVETVILLFLCLQYYLYTLKEDQGNFMNDPPFWIITGLSIFVVTTFAVYLFYAPAFYSNPPSAVNLWKIPKTALLILCVFIAKAFYVSK